MNNLNIYQKINQAQGGVEAIVKSNLNKFQSYKYFTEYQALTIIRPLLTKHGLTLTFSDSNEELIINELTDQKGSKNWVVKYKKLAILTNIDQPAEQLTFNFWAMGQNADIAKAKGSADTYAVKYFLSKFFLIPITDNLDADNR